MSNELAISGVTSVLQFYLGNVYSNLTTFFGGTVSVTSQAPDLVQSSLGGGATPENQVNLFMHQVTHNTGWRNADLPSLGADGQKRLKSPPLALDLHYLLTAYGSADWQAEALLGYALMMLHENPVMTRDDIRHAFTALPAQYPTNPLSTAIGTSELADQIEMIKILPSPLGREEMAWLWTALKADYRPTYPFQVSVVLMMPKRETSLGWPVLLRQLQVQPQTPMSILAVQPPNSQTGAAPGDSVVVTGIFLNGANLVLLSNQKLGIHWPVVPATVTNNSLTFVVPNNVVNFPAGLYDLTVQFKDTTSGLIIQNSNTLLLAVAPVIPTQTATVVSNTDGLLVTVNFSPDARQGQSVTLALSSATALSSTMAPAQPFTGSQSSLGFQFPATLPTGAQLARLVVDGVTSQVQVNWAVHPPAFTGPTVTI
ncbi:MAG TPA: DUF4255 domain-containing protein [Acidobacteriaceae bacterium]